jgi:hypothetical protein
VLKLEVRSPRDIQANGISLRELLLVGITNIYIYVGPTITSVLNISLFYSMLCSLSEVVAGSLFCISIVIC